MIIVVTLCAWIAGGILVASGLLKVGRIEQFQRSLPALGVPLLLQRRWFARAFPIGEVALGLAVIAAPSAVSRLALIAAVILFAVFLAIAIRAVRAPDEVECECFGGLGEARMTGVTVLRNSLFLGISAAGLAATESPTSLAHTEFGLGWAPVVITLLLIGALVIFRNSSSRSTATGAAQPTPVIPAPAAGDDDLTLQTVDGTEIALTDFQDPPTHLVFFSPDCSSCHSLVERFRWWPHGLRDGDDIQPVFLGAPADFADYEVYAPLAPHALYDPTRTVARRLGLRGTPGHAYVTHEHPLGTGWNAGDVAIEAAVLRPGFFEERDTEAAKDAGRSGA